MSKPTEYASPRGIHAPGKWRDLDQPRRSLDTAVVHPVTVSWGDCDPAQIAYTANIPAWGLLAIEAWYQQCVGANWFELNLHYGIGTPFVSLDFAFKSPVRPTALLEVTVLVNKLGNTSITHHVSAAQQDAVCFTGNTTAVFVEAGSMQPMPVPDNIRQSISHYMGIQDHGKN